MKDGVYNNSFTIRRIEMIDRPGMSMVRVPRTWIDSLKKGTIASAYDAFRSFEVIKKDYDLDAYYVIMKDEYAIGLMGSIKDKQQAIDGDQLEHVQNDGKSTAGSHDGACYYCGESMDKQSQVYRYIDVCTDRYRPYPGHKECIDLIRSLSDDVGEINMAGYARGMLSKYVSEDDQYRGSLSLKILKNMYPDMYKDPSGNAICGLCGEPMIAASTKRTVQGVARGVHIHCYYFMWALPREDYHEDDEYSLQRVIETSEEPDKRQQAQQILDYITKSKP